MFGRVAPRYDLLNHLLSFNIDRGWRKVMTASLAPVLSRPDARILDLCCGTGDVLLELQRESASRVYGADFCHPMLLEAKAKARFNPLFEADALRLPLADRSLDAITIAFGFRNLANYTDGLRELRRVLRPGGILAILEFSHPPRLLMKVSYGLYLRVLLPLVGGLISGSLSAYSYLPNSIRKFPTADELRSLMLQAGFTQADYHLLTGGIAALHLGACAV
jgi:demethylmenaquinone methyltransferase/2-methoxy-6-polyprenyl-1,4-benzoquinol methylase